MGTIEQYDKQVYAHKFDNLGKMDQFLEIHNLPELMKEIDNLSTQDFIY